MPILKNYVSPKGRVLKWITKTHIRLYEATGGLIGMSFPSPDDRFQRMDCLLLTTIGRKSGLRRQVALPFFEYEGRTFVFASNAAQKNHPAWFLNLRDTPQVEVQIGPARLSLQAVALQGEERQRIWQQHVTQWPRWADYQRQTEREIPVVELRSAPDR